MKISELQQSEFQLVNETSRLAIENEEMKKYCENSDQRIRGAGYEAKKLWQERRL